MPKLLIDYSKTIMYKIVCKDLSITDVYIGHTTDFIKRKHNHKASCNNENSKSYHYKLYQFIRDNGNWNNFDMIEIEKYPCNDGNEAGSRERYWYEELNATLNKCIPCRNMKQYYQDNKDKIIDNQKGYYQNNREKIIDQKKEYYENNKDKFKNYQKDYYKDNKENYKIYYRCNKDKLIDYQKQYNKNKLLLNQECNNQCDSDF